MKAPISVFVLLFSFCICRAQQNNRESAIKWYNEVLKSKNIDTSHIKALNNYARIIRFDSADKALQYADTAQEIAARIHADYWLAQSYFTISLIYTRLGDYDKTLINADSSILLFEKLKKLPELSGVTNLKAEILYNRGELSKAIDLYHEVMNMNLQTKRVREAAIAYGNIGNIYLDLELYAEAIRYYKKAIDGFKSLKDSLLIGVAYQNIGYTYNQMHVPDSAQRYLLWSMEIFRVLNRNDMYFNSSRNLGESMCLLGAYQKGLKMIAEGLANARQRKAQHEITIALFQMGKVINMAAASDPDHYSYIQAIKYLDSALVYANKEGTIKLETLIKKELAISYRAIGNYKNAYNNLAAYLTLSDSISSAHKKQEISIKELEFEHEKRDELTRARYEARMESQRNKRNYLLTGAVLILVAAGLLFYSYKRRRDAESRQRLAEFKAQITDTEMKVMRLQMNPHFIFNSLNSISDYIRKNNPEEADEYLSKFARVMRMILENSEQATISLKDDLHMLELYMQLEARRLNHKFSYHIEVAEDVDQDNTQVPPMLFQPFVENSIWHGLAGKEGKGKISIMIRKEGERLHCIIEDDGLGLGNASGPKTRDKKISMGMKITQTRLDLLNKLKGGNATVQLIDKPDANGVKAELSLPVTLNF